MNLRIQDIKQKFIEQENLNTRKVYLSDIENEQVLRKFNTSDFDEAEVREKYKTETNADGKIRFYSEQPQGETTDEELQQYSNLKIATRIDSIDSTLSTIKYILVFWLVLTIIGLVGLFYIWYRLRNIF